MARTPNQRAADSHEAQVQAGLADIYGEASHKVTGSGNQSGKPGDVRVFHNWLVECKTTAAESLSVKFDWLRKVRDEAWMGGLRSMLSIRFGNDRNRIYYVLEDVDLYGLLKSEAELKRLTNDLE